MPQRRPEAGDGSPPVRDAMLVYASLGFSVIPILPGTKKPFGVLLPDGKWTPFQQHPATPAEINRWVDQRPDTGAAVVCGEVSGQLYCLDVDDVEFALHLETVMLDRLIQGNAWVVRTGSGKLHIWIRSHEKVLTGHLIGGGRKLADVRGDGQGNSGSSYIVVPPTLHPSGKPYVTLAGSPETVSWTADARVLFDTLRDTYTQVHGDIVPRPTEEVSESMGMAEVDDPGEIAQMRSEILADPRLSRKTKNAVLDGAHVGEGQWAGAPSGSEIDHFVIAELRATGRDAEYINRIFAWSPLGGPRYRNRHKGTWGRAYVNKSLESLSRQETLAAEATKEAVGNNFTVIRATRIGYEEPIYELTILIHSYNREGTVRLMVDDLMEEHRFMREVGKALQFFPRVDKKYGGRGFDKFGGKVLEMADTETVPDTATSGGHLRATVMAFVVSEIAPQRPEDFRMVTLGWRENGRALIRGGALMQRLQNAIRPAPKPEQVWATLRGLGSEEVAHKWPTGRTEVLWSVPMRE